MHIVLSHVWTEPCCTHFCCFSKSSLIDVVVLTTEWQWLAGDVRFLTAGLTFQLAEVVVEDARVPTDRLEEVGAGGTVAGLGLAAGGVGRGGAGEGGAGLGGAGPVVLQLQLTRVSQADSPVQLTLAIVGLVVVAADWPVDWRTVRAPALHQPPRLAGAGGGLVTVQSGADTLRVAPPAVHHDQLGVLQTTLLQQQHLSIIVLILYTVILYSCCTQ